MNQEPKKVGGKTKWSVVALSFAAMSENTYQTLFKDGGTVDILTWLVEHAEKIGVVAILLVVIAGLVWVAKKLYIQERECRNARMIDAQERADMSRTLGELSSDVKNLKQANAMYDLHMQVLKEGKPI